MAHNVSGQRGRNCRGNGHYRGRGRGRSRGGSALAASRHAESQHFQPHWVPESPAKPKTQPCVELSICSYNTLCQDTIERTMFLYGHVGGSDWLRWQHRWTWLRKDVQRIAADIYCFQEIQDQHFGQFYKPFMQELGYDGYRYKKRTGKFCDGCAVFFRTSNLTIEETEDVEFFDAPTGFMNRDNVAQVIRFKPAGGQRTATRLVVANTHLLFNPRREDVRLGQMATLLAVVQKLASTGFSAEGVPLEPHPVIICGDFNTSIDSVTYQLLTQGSVNWLSHPHVQPSRHGPSFLPEASGIGCWCTFRTFGSPSHPPPSRRGDRRSRPVSSQPYNGREWPELSSVGDTEQNSLPHGVIGHRLPLVSVYRHASYLNNEESLEEFQNMIYNMGWGWAQFESSRECTTHHSKETDNVDYMFYSVGSKVSQRCLPALPDAPFGFKVSGVVEGKLKLVARLALPTYKDVDEGRLRKMPNEVRGSDHLPIGAKFWLSL